MLKKGSFYTLSIIVALSLVLASCSGSGQQAFAFEKVKLQKGDLTSFVVANGVIRPVRTAEVSWKTSGQVGKMLVSALDTVSDGQRIGEIAESSLPVTFLSAKLDLLNAQKALDNLQYWQTDAEQARLAIVQCQEDLDTATKKLNGVNGRNRPIAEFYIQAAQAELYLAEEDVDKKQNTYDHTPDGSEYKAIALKDVAAAKQRRDKALANLNYLTGKPSQMELDRANAEVALAQSKLDDAQRQYDNIKNGTPTSDIEAAKMRVQIAQATLEQSYISAPFAGIITSVDSRQGDLVQAGSQAVTIEDQSHMYVIAQVSEVDVNRMKVGQAVNITLDAVFGATYHGKIVEIGQSGTSTQGVVNFPVKVELTDRDDKVKPGMTAVLNIQAETVTGVLLVPNRAVRVVDGNRVVYVEKGLPMPVAVPITLGISSDLVSQVLSGEVKEGDVIILNPDILTSAQGAQTTVR